MVSLDNEVARTFTLLLNKSRIHSFDDVVSVVAAYEKACEHALARNEMEPNYSLGIRIGAQLEDIRNQLLVVQKGWEQTPYHPHLQNLSFPVFVVSYIMGDERFEKWMEKKHPVVDSPHLVDFYFALDESGFPLRVQIPVNQARNSEHGIVNIASSRVKYQVMRLEDLYVKADKATEFEVIPDDVIGAEYLKQGRIIVPPTTTSQDFRVFSINWHQCSSCNADYINLRPESRGHYSVEESVQSIDKTIIGTIAIAHNVRDYPLDQTIIPVLERKYEMILFGARHNPLLFLHGNYK